jgi:GNAT superfamily N-acetyltransferase
MRRQARRSVRASVTGHTESPRAAADTGFVDPSIASLAPVAVTLRDGAELALRPILPPDKAALVAFHERLSERSQYRRYFAPKPRLTSRELAYLTELDFADHVAVVAVPAAEPGRIVAVGRWIRLRDEPATAEAAILVADKLQGRGLGRAIADTLADTALERGIGRFLATMLSENVAAHRLFSSMSERVTTDHHGVVDDLLVELAA